MSIFCVLPVPLRDCLYREKDVGGGLYVCVLFCFIKPILGNRYARSRGFIVSEPRRCTHDPRSPCHGHISHLVHPKTLLWLEHAKKGPKNLANTSSDTLAILKKNNSFRRWQIPLAVTSSTWQTSQLDKLTWQVDLPPYPFAPLEITWRVITCPVDLSSQLEQSSDHASVGPWIISRCCATLSAIGCTILVFFLLSLYPLVRTACCAPNFWGEEELLQEGRFWGTLGLLGLNPGPSSWYITLGLPDAGSFFHGGSEAFKGGGLPSGRRSCRVYILLLDRDSEWCVREWR